MPETVTETETEVVEPKPAEPAETAEVEEVEQTEDLGDAGKTALHKEREARRKAEAARRVAETKAGAVQKQLDALVAKVKSFEDRDKSESQRQADAIAELNKQIDLKNAELTAAQTAHVKAEVAAQKGVPASSLTGETREEFESSADELIVWRDANKPPPRKAPTTSPGLKSGASATADHPADAKERAAQALRNLRRGS